MHLFFLAILGLTCPNSVIHLGQLYDSIFMMDLWLVGQCGFYTVFKGGYIHDQQDKGYEIMMTFEM